MKRSITCDGILIENKQILLILRKNDPDRGLWALPGGYLEENEFTEQCVVREFLEETGIQTKIHFLSGVYSDPKRDSRGNVTLAYLLGQVGGKIAPNSDASQAKWFSLDALPKLAFDHEKILKDAVKLIRIN